MKKKIFLLKKDAIRKMEKINKIIICPLLQSHLYLYRMNFDHWLGLFGARWLLCAKTMTGPNVPNCSWRSYRLGNGTIWRNTFETRFVFFFYSCFTVSRKWRNDYIEADQKRAKSALIFCRCGMFIPLATFGLVSYKTCNFLSLNFKKKKVI